jgi:hypothetical protein
MDTSMVDEVCPRVLTHPIDTRVDAAHDPRRECEQFAYKREDEMTTSLGRRSEQHRHCGQGTLWGYTF